MMVIELGGAFAISVAVGAWRSVASGKPIGRLVALHQAAASGQNHVITELIEGGLLVDAVLEDGETALSTAAANGHASTVLHLLSFGASPRVASRADSLPVHVAAARGDVMVLTRILEADSGCADLQDKRGYTALHHACTHGHVAATEALLVGFGFAVDAQASAIEGSTPLALAVKANSVACVRLLLEHGGHTEEADAAGDTPLHRACTGSPVFTFPTASTNELEIARLLLEAGASMLLPNRRGVTAVDLAARTEAMAELLSRHHASRLQAGQHEANVAHLVRSRLLDQLRVLSREDPVALHDLCEERETKALLRRYGIDVTHAAGGAAACASQDGGSAVLSAVPLGAPVAAGRSSKAAAGPLRSVLVHSDGGANEGDAPPTTRAMQEVQRLGETLELEANAASQLLDHAPLTAADSHAI